MMLVPPLMDKPLYYRTRVMDLDAPEIAGMCADLLAAVNYVPGEGYDLQLWKWLSWFFQENPPATLTARHFLPGSALVTRISKMTGTPLYGFCAELARERHLGLEAYENGTLLSLLKAVFRKEQQLSSPNSRRQPNHLRSSHA
jgi:hypothetical protein